jgi:hypothetical protein
MVHDLSRKKGETFKDYLWSIVDERSDLWWSVAKKPWKLLLRSQVFVELHVLACFPRAIDLSASTRPPLLHCIVQIVNNHYDTSLAT